MNAAVTSADAAERVAPPNDRHPMARIVRALTRSESGHLLRHPSLLIGVALSVLLIRTAASGNILTEADGDVALGLVPLAWATLIATNLSALRGRRDGSAELFGSLPSAPATRTAAQLLAGWVAVVAGVIVLIGWLVLEWRSGLAIGSPNVAQLVIGPLLVAGAAALGVLAARWLPHPIVGPLVVVATTVVQAGPLSSGTSPLRWMAFAADATSPASAPGDDGIAFPGPVDWHVLYIGGTILIAGVLAVARHGFSRRVSLALAGAAALAGVAAVGQTRPLSDDEISRRDALLTNPPAVCEVRSAVRYCAPGDFRARFGQWEGPVKAVLRRTPAEVRDRGLVVSMRDLNVTSSPDCTPTPLLALLPPRVRAAVDPAAVWPADGAVHPDREWPWDEECTFTDHGVALTVQVGAWAVGLPPAQAAASSPCQASGQARSVVALWLAGQATPGGVRGLADIGRASGPGTTVDFGDSANQPSWGVAYAKADLALALALLERPVDDVARIVTESWEQLVNPSTPSAILGARAGIPAAASVAGSAESTNAPRCP